jgi:hypothetical protein
MQRWLYPVWFGSFVVLSLGLVVPAHGQYRVQKSAFGNGGRNGFLQQAPGFSGQAAMQKMCGNGQGRTPFSQGGGMMGPFSQNGGLQNPSLQGGGLQNPFLQGGGLQNRFPQRGGLQNPFLQGGGLQNPLAPGIGGNGPIDPAQLQLMIQMLQNQAAATQMQAPLQQASGPWFQQQ